VKEKILEVEAQVKALPVGHAERRLHLECLAALQSQLASLRQQGTRLPLMHGLCMAPPVSPLHGFSVRAPLRQGPTMGQIGLGVSSF
jgi:hypothetical protein